MSIAPTETIVLASASTARARLLAAAGLAVTIERAGLDEAEIKRTFRRERRNIGECAIALAEAKASCVSARRPCALIIGADQMLHCDGHWFDKPDDLSDARDQLLALRGKRHEIVSAAVIVRNGSVLWRTLDRARLTMRSFTDGFLDAYLDAIGDRAVATVGAYELEGLGAQLFEQVEGDYFSILGLPLLALLDFLRGYGVLRS